MLQKKLKNIGLLSCIYLFTLCYLLFAGVAHAQTPGVEVRPSLIQLDLAKDSPQSTITYINHTKNQIILTFSVSTLTQFDMSAETTLLQPKNIQDSEYGLSNWIEFSNNTLLLSPSQKGSVTVFIDKNKLSAGGHYGSFLAQIQEGNSSGNVTLHGVLATLIFVRANTGKEFEKGSITTFAPEQNFWDFPSNFLLRFTNSGDTFVIPYGKADITDSSGNLVARGILNQGSLMVLPQTLRRYEIPVNSFSKIIWPGMYKANLSIHFGKSNQTLESSVSFFTFGNLPIPQILLILIVLVIIFWVVRKGQKTKEE